MAWTQITDNFPDDPETLDLDRSTRLLHIEALVYSNRWGRNGHVPAKSLSRVTDHPDPDSAVAELLAAGWWEAVEDGWQLVKLQGDQLEAEEVQRRRDNNKNRQARWRRHNAGDHTLCDPKRCKESKSAVTERVTSRVTERVTNGVSNGTPSHPIPSHPGMDGYMGRAVPSTPPAPDPDCNLCDDEGYRLLANGTTGGRCDHVYRNTADRLERAKQIAAAGRA